MSKRSTDKQRLDWMQRRGRYIDCHQAKPPTERWYAAIDAGPPETGRSLRQVIDKLMSARRGRKGAAMSGEPDHHRRYREAWDAYRTCFDDADAQLLERAMDAAQNSFGWDEFQEFKQTLPGYVEYWAFLASPDGLRKLMNRAGRPDPGGTER